MLFPHPHCPTVVGRPVDSPQRYINTPCKETMRKIESPLHVKYLQTMAECLCMLGKVAAAGAIICQRLRPTIHEIITSKIKGEAEYVNSCRAGVGQVA
ncbi:hypothetical protein L2E82_46934 [Cichorium intybus]|uniref:Uncharacterized protein n=1 Tax=Cichorium intybus TaxID=13427 RepID=A0ACB8YUL9_CICIN|nr:hypothetical protein L2E82_46934 [Cichorium intybus]